MKHKPKNYTDFTLEHLSNMFGIVGIAERLNLPTAPFVVPDWLIAQIQAVEGLPNATEKAKSEFYISPILTALFTANVGKFKYFSGYTFDVDKSKALKGRCDYLLSKSNALFIDAPIFGIFEAKDDNLENWYGQCGAEMYAAQLFNAQKGKPLAFVYGAVTNGLNWQFLRLQNTDLQIDTKYYTLQDLPTLLGTLQGILALYD
jgi:hypothetical protein